MRLLPKVLMTMLTLFTASAFPYELQRLPKDGTAVRWQSQRIVLSVSSSFREESPAARGGWKPIEAIRRAAQEWSSASGLEIILTDSNSQSISPTGKRGDGVSLITIAQTPENLILFSGENSSRPAFTRVFFDGKGRILEADVVINPYHPVSTDGIFGSFDLESTLVHEIGHVLGLGHSQVLGTSMNEASAKNGLYTVPFTSFRTLSADDISGIRALYPESEASSDCCGTIDGKLTGDLGKEREFVVWAEDAERGSVGASVKVTEEGRFKLQGIPDGEYKLFVRASDGHSRIVELGNVSVSVDSEELIEFEVKVAGAKANISLAGFNGQLSEVSVPVNAGNAFKLFVGGAGELAAPRIEISSPDIVIEDGTLELLDYGKDTMVLSFVAEVGDGVPRGDFTIRLYDGDVLIDCLVGAVSVDSDVNPWVHRDL